MTVLWLTYRSLTWLIQQKGITNCIQYNHYENIVTGGDCPERVLDTHFKIFGSL